MILRVLLLACVGVAAEVAFTAALDRHDARLRGYSYLWMFPVYAALYPGYAFLLPSIASWPLLARGAFYGALLILGELVFGLLLKAALGSAPWEPEYSGKPRVIAGVARLDYFPAWFAAGLLFERVFRLLSTS